MQNKALKSKEENELESCKCGNKSTHKWLAMFPVCSDCYHKLLNEAQDRTKSISNNELITVEGINYRHCEDGHQHVLYQGHTCPMCVVRIYMQDCYDGIFKGKV